jgi:predicted TIM-barrel fold metal-dependent hydrolase
MSSYRVISSDSHMIEAADLWEKRIDRRFKDRAPRIVHTEESDQWYCDGVPFGFIGINQQAGLRFETPEELTIAGKMETVRPGGTDPHAHVKDLELDGVAGGVIYPSQGLTLFRIPDSDLLSACFRAYNDHLAEFCAPYPHCLKGIAMVNVDDVDEGVHELERAARMGLAGAMIATGPAVRYDHSDYEPFWAAAQDLDMPLSLHTGCERWQPGMDISTHTLEALHYPTVDFHMRNSIAAMILSGVFERYPKLKVGAVEFEISWAPYFMGRLDDAYQHRAAGQTGFRFKGGGLPSEMFRRNIFISFQEDDLGIQLRHHVGVDNLLWGSDYPHAESTFPRSREIVERMLDGVAEDEKAKIVGENTARLYHFD